MGQDPVLMWPYLLHFVTHSTDFVYLAVFHDALSGYGIKGEKF